MSDRRTLPEELRDSGEVMSVAVPLADLRAAPDGKRDRQLVYGEDFRVVEVHGGWAYGSAEKDGYAGYLRLANLEARREATHFVSVRSSHIYPEPDFKSEAIASLSFGSRLEVVGKGERFAELSGGGFVPCPHIAPVDRLFDDPIEVAEQFMGVPYLWGGNSIWGLDCSGLVQVVLLACGVDCPGDADMQQDRVGVAIGDNVKPQRGDLFFWKGHVGLIRDENTLLHANAYHMAVVDESLDQAIARIEAQGDGPVTGRRRPVFPA
ncbi:C40 family peptidase [Profundibacter amoris]|nr:NlpC/P60 family protein [Profundibacter amoris]